MVIGLVRLNDSNRRSQPWLLLAATADELLTDETWQARINPRFRQLATEMRSRGLQEVADVYDLMGQEPQTVAKRTRKGVEGSQT